MQRSTLCAVAVAVVVIGSCGAANDSPDPEPDGVTDQGSSSGIEGAWTLTEYRPASGTPASSPAGVFLFSPNHYSMMFSNQAGPRSTFADANAPTDSERLNAFATFIANSGTYTVNGDTLTIRPIISKHPNYMGGGEDKFTMRVAGDTLWLTNVAGSFRWADGPSSPDTTSAVDSFILVRSR